MSKWNLADVWEVIVEERPRAMAVAHGERRLSWADFDRRAGAVAAGLVGFGIHRQESVAQYLYNSPEYLECVFACFKASLVPVNTNFRYTDDELVYLWDNADAAAVVFHGTFAEPIERIRARLPRVKGWLWVDDGAGACPGWAVPYEQAAAGGGSPPRWGRSPDDLYLLYTGGTTGMPKGVMWRQDDLFAALNRTAELRYPEDGGLDDIRDGLRHAKRPPPVAVPCPPLMHGAGAFASFSVLDSGGSIVLLEGRRFSASELLETIERQRVTQITIVGDAFAKPLLAELDAHPGRSDISSLRVIVSSGVMWAAETKDRLLRHQPNLYLVDTLGSSEAIGVAQSRSSSHHTAETAGFRLGPGARVIDEEGSHVVAGSGVAGRLAVRGRTPIGYYKDPDKSAATFKTVDGSRWSIPGDWATVDIDGTVRLLGRGSACINSGGEKIFPEEVEEALKTHPSVADAVAVGVPDERFGEAVVALVEGFGGATVDEIDVIAHVKGRLASFKAPQHVLTVASLSRDTNGKVNYRRLRDVAVDRLSASAVESPPALIE